MTTYLTEEEVIARVEGLTVARLRSFTATRCVEPLSRDGQTIFAEPDVARLQLLCEISADFDLDEEAAALVLSLVDQIHGLRRALRGLADAISEEPEEVRARIRARAATRQV
ncbi:MAG TPA: hypothetical protein VK022_04830 [Paracoccaceae bacterium]|nr:hypothetical protein [Paracoccaceae bacterium]